MLAGEWRLHGEIVANPGAGGTIETMRRLRMLITMILSLGLVFAAAATPAADTAEPRAGMFLVATRALDGSHFGGTVVYLVEHGDDGSLGLIVNRPGHVSLSEALPDVDAAQASGHRLYYGGPVGASTILMLLRSDAAARGMAWVEDDIYLSADRRVLESLLAQNKPARELHFYLGHSGWSAGQLAGELERGSWHVVAGDTDAIFSAEVDSLWHRLIESLEPEGIQVQRPAPAGLALAPAVGPGPHPRR